MQTFFKKVQGRIKPWFLLMMIISPVSKHANANPNLGVRAQSFGGAYRAVATSNDIIFYNPAGVLVHRRIGVDVDYKVAPYSHHHQLGASIVDSKTTSWGLGLAYNAGINPKSNLATTHAFSLAVAMPILTDALSFGSSLSYVYDPSLVNAPYRHFLNIDLGLMVMLPIGLNFALVADHLLRSKGAEKSLGLALAGAFDLGVVLSAVPLTVSFDWLIDNLKSDNNLDHILGVGAEYLVFSVLPIRLGLKSEIKENNQLISMGTGLQLKQLALDGLYQQHLTIGRIRYFGLALRFAL